MRNLTKKQKALIGTGIGIFMMICIYVAVIGRVLVREDPLEPADQIVVLMGSTPDRMLGAVELYQSGYGEKIVMVQTYIRGADILDAKGVHIPLSAQIEKMIGVQLGVPAEDIIVLEGDTMSTKDEAIVIREYFKEHTALDSMILVTSKYHSFRAKMLFEKALKGLGREVKVISRPTEYDSFHRERWWSNREDIKNVIYETLKIMNYSISDRFQL